MYFYSGNFSWYKLIFHFRGYSFSAVSIITLNLLFTTFFFLVLATCLFGIEPQIFHHIQHIGTRHQGEFVIYILVNHSKCFDCHFLETFMQCFKRLLRLMP